VRDEIKHLSILGCAYMYLFGPRFWKRLLDCVKLGITNYRQRRNRSGGDLLGSNPILAIEGIAAHLLTAQYLTKWLKTVPLSALTTVFETPSKLPDLAALQSNIDVQRDLGFLKRPIDVRTTSRVLHSKTDSSDRPITGEIARGLLNRSSGIMATKKGHAPL